MPIQINDNGVINELIDSENDLSPLLRSTEVTELISNKPTFIVRWGITLLLGIAILLLATTWFIKYPDMVKANGVFNSIHPPRLVISNADGRLVKLFIKEGDRVHTNAVVGFMESIANHQSVINISISLDSIQLNVKNNKPEVLVKYFSQNNTNLGELQPQYQVFKQAFLSFSNYFASGFYLKKKGILYTDMANLRKLHSNLIFQKSILEEDLALVQHTFDANDTLKRQKVISEGDYRIEKSKLLNKSLTIPHLNASIISNESQQNDKKKEILELENNIAQQKIIFEQALNTFKSQVDEWMKKYLLIAPIDGKISFASFIQENQQIKTGQPICYIKPENSLYYAEIHIPQTNFGKIKMGQKVLLKLPAYPYAEFGSIEGRVNFISRIPVDNSYAAKIILPNGLLTNYAKPVYFTEGLKANAEIITEDLSLLERFYYSIYNLS